MTNEPSDDNPVDVFDIFDAKTTASLVNSIIDEIGLNKNKVADLIGVSRRTLYRWTSAERIPKPFSLEKLNELLSFHREGYRYDFDERKWLKKTKEEHKKFACSSLSKINKQLSKCYGGN